MEFHTINLKENFDTEKFEELVKKISELPTGEQFKEKAENEMWKLVTDSNEEEIAYESLPESSKGLIGYIPGKEGEDELPDRKSVV